MLHDPDAMADTVTFTGIKLVTDRALVNAKTVDVVLMKELFKVKVDDSELTMEAANVIPPPLLFEVTAVVLLVSCVTFPP